jgi:hypothetical protein
LGRDPLREATDPGEIVGDAVTKIGKTQWAASTSDRSTNIRLNSCSRITSGRVSAR